MKFLLIAVGKDPNSALSEAANLYSKRLRAHFDLLEISIKGEQDPGKLNALENEKILKSIPESYFVIALDKEGKNLSSLELSKLISHTLATQSSNICFVIGGSDGLDARVKKRANMLLSFGKQTWPHMLARVMLLEQLYRAQQIESGHPYHK